MSALHILFVGSDHEQGRLDDLAAGLRRRGHTTALVSSTDDALGMETPDALVVTEAIGPGLFQAFALPTGSPRCVFLVAEPTFRIAAAAAHAGARELLHQPTLDELARAIEAGDARPEPEPLTHFERSYTSDQPHAAVRDLAAHALRLGLSRGLRVRIATAASELLHNVAQHAYPADADHGGLGPVTLFARLASDPLGIDRLSIEVVDHGAGATSIDASGDAPQGLDFVRALAERVDITTAPGEGFCVRAEFALATQYFDETPAGLDELDHLDPITLRELHRAATSGEDLARLAPALAPTLGRLQTAGLDPLSSLTLR